MHVVFGLGYCVLRWGCALITELLEPLPRGSDGFRAEQAVIRLRVVGHESLDAQVEAIRISEISESPRRLVLHHEPFHELDHRVTVHGTLNGLAVAVSPILPSLTSLGYVRDLRARSRID